MQINNSIVEINGVYSIAESFSFKAVNWSISIKTLSDSNGQVPPNCAKLWLPGCHGLGAGGKKRKWRDSLRTAGHSAHFTPIFNLNKSSNSQTNVTVRRINSQFNSLPFPSFGGIASAAPRHPASFNCIYPPSNLAERQTPLSLLDKWGCEAQRS